MNKASGGDRNLVELFQILKDDAVKVLHSIYQQNWKTKQWSQDWKRSVFIPIPKKGNAKECSNYRIIALISHTSKVVLKILQARLQQYMNHELPDVQAGFKKAEEPEIKLPEIKLPKKTKRVPDKKIYFCLLTMPKPYTVSITTNYAKFLRDENTRPPDLPPEKSIQVKKQQLELDMEQQTGSKSGKEYVKASYCHLAYLTYIQSTSCEMLG